VGNVFAKGQNYGRKNILFILNNNVFSGLYTHSGKIVCNLIHPTNK